MNLLVGDYVEHENHGVGQYDGTICFVRDGVEKIYMVLRYAQKDKLFIPLGQEDKIKKFDGIPVLQRMKYITTFKPWFCGKAKMQSASSYPDKVKIIPPS